MSLTAAIAIAKYAPDVLRWFGGDDEADIAEKVVGVAQKLTGTDNADVAADLVENDPELQVELAKAMQPVIVAQYQEESRRLESINTTMRIEIQSDDKFKSYWRPFFGYVLALSWGCMMFAVTYLIFSEPEKADRVINSFASMGMMWSVALGVLGVQISSRSKDKQVANGLMPSPGIMSAIVARVAGKK